MKIIPAILPQRYRDIENAVDKVFDVVKTIQIDFVDGFFATNRTWWFNGKDQEVFGEFEREERGLPHWQDINYELDLMVRNPLALLDQFFMLGPAKIVLHVETLNEEETIQYFESLPEIVRSTIDFSIAINIYTDPQAIKPYLPFIIGIQCMGIAVIGYQAQPFDPKAIEQIQKLKELYPDKSIAVDGAVSQENIKSLIEAGATEFVIGSSIFGNNDPRGTIRIFNNLCNEVDSTVSEN